MIKDYKEELTDLGEQVEGEDPKTTSTRQEVTSELEKTWVSKTSVSKFHRNTDFWNAESQCILGHVVYTPPISVSTGDSKFTKDWALVELNHAKFNWDSSGRLHNGTNISPVSRLAQLQIPRAWKKAGLPVARHKLSGCKRGGVCTEKVRDRRSRELGRQRGEG